MLVLSGIMLAMATVLSELTKFDGLWAMGGSVTLLSMLPVCVLSIKYGVKWGVFTAFIYSVVQLCFGLGNLQWAQNALVAFGIVMLDYILPFTGLGFAGVFRKKGYLGWCGGVVVVIAFRFICHFISGVIIWGQWNVGESWVNSLVYNCSYMLPELVITVAGAAALYSVPQVRTMIRSE
jgi:thiamine transporter